MRVRGREVEWILKSGDESIVVLSSGTLERRSLGRDTIWKSVDDDEA